MTDIAFPDEWLGRSLEGILTPERLDEIRAKAEPNRTLWETLVAQSVVSDEQILDALSTRFRLKICDLAQLDAKVKDGIPEALAEMYKPEKSLDKLLDSMEGSAELVQLADQESAEEINISAEEASQRPVVRL